MGFAVDEWLSELSQQFAYYAAEFVDEGARIRFAVAHLAGSAVQWWEQEAKAQPPRVVSWATFVDRLHERFRPVQAAMVARQQLGKLRMRPGDSVNKYAGTFHTILTPVVDMGEMDQVHHFVNGLFPHFAGKVWEQRCAPTLFWSPTLLLGCRFYDSPVVATG